MAKKKKKKTVTLVSLLLDETGSMSTRVSQTLSGVNEYILGLKQAKGKTIVTVTLFNSNRTKVLFNGKKASIVPEITTAHYKPAATTPLYDAIAAAIHAVDKRLERVQGNPGVLFVIVTDGLENASKEFTQEDVFDMIEKRTEEDWTFAYLGADQDAFEVGGDLGIPKGNTVAFVGDKIAETMSMTASATRSYMEEGSVSTLDLFEGIDTSDVDYDHTGQQQEELEIVIDDSTDKED